MGFVGHYWSCAVEFANYGGPTGTLTTTGSLIIFLAMLKIGSYYQMLLVWLSLDKAQMV